MIVLHAITCYLCLLWFYIKFSNTCISAVQWQDIVVHITNFDLILCNHTMHNHSSLSCKAYPDTSLKTSLSWLPPACLEQTYFIFQTYEKCHRFVYNNNNAGNRASAPLMKVELFTLPSPVKSACLGCTANRIFLHVYQYCKGPLNHNTCITYQCQNTIYSMRLYWMVVHKSFTEIGNE